jgi:hypothetical protein
MNLPGVTDLIWTAPRTISTGEGPMQLKKATPNQAFWELWRKYGPAFSDAGFSVSEFPRDSGKWTVNWWDRGRGFTLPMLIKEPARGVWHNVKTNPPPLNKSLMVRRGPIIWDSAFDGRKWEGVGASRGINQKKKPRKKKGEDAELIPAPPKVIPFSDEGTPLEWFEPPKYED